MLHFSHPGFSRWLSKGKSLERIWCLRTSLIEFLKSQNRPNVQMFLDMLTDEQTSFDMAFLVDILGKLNDLNLKLQGKHFNTC